MKFKDENIAVLEDTPVENYMNELNLYPTNIQNLTLSTSLITNLQVQENILMNDFSSNVRNEIRKCNKDYKPQIYINENPTEEDIEKHLKYYKNWMESKGLELYGNIEFYRNRLNLYRKNHCLVIIVGKSELVSSHIEDTYFIDNEKKIVRLTTSISTFRNNDSLTKKINGSLNKFLKYKSLKHFSNKNFRQFDWGGISQPSADKNINGVSEFKKQFSKILCKYYSFDMKINKNIKRKFTIMKLIKNLFKRNKPKICILCDRPNWAFDISAKEIVNQLSDEFCFDIKYVVDKPKLRPKDYDLLHVCFWGETYHQKFRFPKKKVLKEISSHRWEDNPMYGPCTPAEMNKKYLFDSNYVFCTSKRLFNLFKNVRTNVHLTENGYNPTKFYYAKERNGEMKLCWAGNIKDEVKGVNDIILPAVGNEFKIDLASDLNHTEMVEFYNNHDVYIIASRNEASPLTLIESMACGCFPVCNDVGIVPELIRHKENGYIVKERTPESYKEAFLWCKENLDFVRQAGKKNAKEIFETKRWEIMAESYRKMYKECLK